MILTVEFVIGQIILKILTFYQEKMWYILLRIHVVNIYVNFLLIATVVF